MSPKLKQFLTEWLQWADAGGKRHKNSAFSPFTGLCYCASQWGGPWLEEELQSILWKEFPDSGIHPASSCPFGGVETYDRDVARHTMHLNPLRVNWVRSKVNEP